MRKDLLVTICLLLITSVISSCGNAKAIATPNKPETREKEAQIITLMMAQGKFSDAYKELQDKLKAEENITLVLQTLPVDQYDNVVKLKIAAREVPDIIVKNVPDRYEELDASKNMVDLSGERWVNRLTNPDLLRAPDGKIYAWPIESSTFYAAAYYNKKVFADLGLIKPTTYAGFLNLLEAIKTSGNGVIPIFMSNKDKWTTQIFITAGLPVLLGDKAKETWDKLLDNRLKWTEVPEFNTILNLYVDLYKKGYVNEDHASTTFEDAKAALAAGMAAMVYNGEWTAADLVATYGMKSDDIGAFIIPFGDRDLMAMGGFVTGWLIPKDAKNIAGAKRVLELLSQPEYMNLYFAKYPGFPGFKDVNGGEVASEVMELAEKYINGNKHTCEMNAPMSFANPLFIDNLWGPYVDISTGEKTPEQVIEAWQVIYEKYMKDKHRPGF
ncbi:ABC transporter substrate-binding protein [Cohnella sp.]|uniref:ABC transporter substrate-binding protein n=1 Tax=Cohnella sp. TaxID=1883426 RepID=UPI0035668DD4